MGTIVLSPERRASGRVLDARTGAPVSGALLKPEHHDNGGRDVAWRRTPPGPGINTVSHAPAVSRERDGFLGSADELQD